MVKEATNQNRRFLLEYQTSIARRNNLINRIVLSKDDPFIDITIKSRNNDVSIAFLCLVWIIIIFWGLNQRSQQQVLNGTINEYEKAQRKSVYCTYTLQNLILLIGVGDKVVARIVNVAFIKEYDHALMELIQITDYVQRLVLIIKKCDSCYDESCYTFINSSIFMLHTHYEIIITTNTCNMPAVSMVFDGTITDICCCCVLWFRKYFRFNFRA